MNINTIKRAVMASLSGLIPSTVLAQGLSGIQPFQGTAQSNLPTAITSIINILLILAALVAGIFLIIGGVQYITSGSDESGQEKAKNRILYAVIGLIFIGLAAAIVNFVVGAIGQA